MTLTIDLPSETPPDQGADYQVMKTRLAVTLYRLQALSHAKAAKLAGLSRSEFMDAVAEDIADTGTFNIDHSYTAEQLRAEIEAA